MAIVTADEVPRIGDLRPFGSVMLRWDGSRWCSIPKPSTARH